MNNLRRIFPGCGSDISLSINSISRIDGFIHLDLSKYFLSNRPHK